MKAKITALNKTYLVEFKDEDQFVSFLTEHNDKVNNVEVINEETLPELEKPVEIAKPSSSDGWKALEKSAFVQKEKGVEKKGMTLGGKYAEFKYEPDKTLDNAADDKVSTPKSDSPALTGDEPKVADVEATAKEAEVEAPKTEATKAEEAKAEPAKEESPKAEEPKEEKSEDKEEKKEEVKESVEDEGFQVWVKDDSNYTECVSIEESEEAAIEEAKRIYDESEDKNIVVFVNDSNTGNTIFSTKEEVEESYDDELDEVMEAAGVETDDNIEAAKQWVLRATVQLQTLKKGEIAPIEKRDVIAKELANAAAIAFDTSVYNILKALQRDHKFFPNTSWK